MKKLILLTAILFSASTTAHAQWWSTSKKVDGNKEVTSQTRNVGNYDRITLTGMMEVQLIAGKEGKINIEGESNLLEYIETEVKGDELKISVKKGYNLQPSKNYPIKLVVPFEDLKELSLTGSGDIRNSDIISSRNFKLQVTGSGDMNLFLKTDILEGNLTGSGDVKLRGTTNEFKCTVTGSGDFLAYDLKAYRAKANVTGSGDIQLSVVSELSAKILGSGDITYNGNPETQDFKTFGSGAISKR